MVNWSGLLTSTLSAVGLITNFLKGMSFQIKFGHRREGQIHIQDVSSPDIDGQLTTIDDPLLTVRILIVHYWWSGVDGSRPSTVDSLNLDVQMLMTNHCWSTIVSPQLIVNGWWSCVDRSRLSRIDCTNFADVNGDGPLLMVNCWQSTFDSWPSTVDGPVLMDLDHERLTVQILMVWILITHYCWSTLRGPLLTINCRLSSVDESAPSIVGSPNFDIADVDHPLLLVKSYLIVHSTIVLSTVKHQNLDSQNPYCSDFDGVDVDGINIDGHLLCTVHIWIVNGWIIFDEKSKCYPKKTKTFSKLQILKKSQIFLKLSHFR